MKKLFVTLLIFFTFYNTSAHAAINYRAFWAPSYHGLPLSYCFNGKDCGRAVAKAYCKKMGYDGVKQYQKRFNVCTSRYLDSDKKCSNWACDGFRKIKCYANDIKNDDYYTKQAQENRFVAPRFGKERVNYCFKSNQGCGRKAAQAFCQRMGYMRVGNYKKQSRIGLSQYIANQAYCLNSDCNGFKYIQCLREQG